MSCCCIKGHYVCSSCESLMKWSTKEGMEVRRMLNAMKSIFMNHACSKSDIKLFMEMFKKVRDYDVAYNDEWFCNFIMSWHEHLEKEKKKELDDLREQLNIRIYEGFKKEEVHK